MDLTNSKDSDPIKRFVEKQSVEELSPMDPPDAYSPPAIDEVSYDEMDDTLKKFIDEHKVCLAKLDAFDGALNKIKTDGFGATKEVNSTLADFFQFVDNNISKHNIKEEKFLFPLLHQRYIESGEHSSGPDKKSAVDLLEDDHIKFMQIAAITFTLFGLAGRLPDPSSRLVVLNLAVEQGKNLVEMLRLHIFREDKIVFPFAQKNLTTDEFQIINEKLENFL